MKRFLPSLLTGIVFLAAAKDVSAQSICPPGNFANLCKLKLENSATIVGSIVTILLILAIILAIIFLIWGGIRWISSGGDKGKVEAARNNITAAIVGLIIALSAFFILNAVTYIVTGQTFSTFTIPTLVP